MTIEIKIVRRANFMVPRYGFTVSPKNDLVMMLAMLNIEEITDAVLTTSIVYVFATSIPFSCFFVYSWYWIICGMAKYNCITLKNVS